MSYPGATLDDVCELLEKLVHQVSLVAAEVEYIKDAIVKKEMEIDCKRWDGLMVEIGDTNVRLDEVRQNIDDVDNHVVDSFAVYFDKLEEFKNEIIDAIPEHE